MFKGMLEISRHENNFHRVDGQTIKLLVRQQPECVEHLERQQHLQPIPNKHPRAGKKQRLIISAQHPQPLLSLPAIHPKMLPLQALIRQLDPTRRLPILCAQLVRHRR